MQRLWQAYTANRSGAAFNLLLFKLSKVKDFSKKLLDWYALYGRRGMPWQNLKDPYRVWLSEIMLQQTQVITVKDRYVQFLQRFPEVTDLAKASLDDVMTLWAGLGYYTRARNLHACAKIIVDQYGGKFPQDAVTLCTLPGIGMSTAAAIAAFCYEQKISILDANVKRLLARVFGIEQDLNKSSVHQELWLKAQSLVPTQSAKMPYYTQALMDFGATVCTPKKPKCESCIYQDSCLAYIQDKVDVIPIKIQKTKSKVVQSEMLFIVAKDQILFELRQTNGIWGGLWSLPESPWQEAQVRKIVPLKLSCEDYSSIPSDTIQLAFKKSKILAPRKHVFTHRVLYFQIRILEIEKPFPVDTKKFQWVNVSQYENLGMPTPVRQWLKDYNAL
jgi:A/G-specific adenine glycosylase